MKSTIIEYAPMLRLRTTLTLLLLALAPAAAWSAPQDGFVLTQWGRWTHEEGLRAVESAAQVGARHISILMTLCQRNLKSSEMRWCEDTGATPLRESYQGRRALKLIEAIQARGMSVSFIPFPVMED